MKPISKASLQQIIESSRSYDLSYIDDPQFGRWRLGEDTCQFLGMICRALKPKVVVEFGSGLSSLILAHEIDQGNVGRVYSIDHLDDFPGHPKQILSNKVKNGSISFHHCPIGRAAYAGKGFQFCNIPNGFIDSIGPVDLVLIDGPPYYYESREAALYSVYPALSDHALILLDDAGRETREQVYLKNWARYYGDNINTALFLKEFEKGLGCVWRTGAQTAVQPFPAFERISHSVKSIVIGVKETVRRIRA